MTQNLVFCYKAVAEEQHCSCLGRHGPGTGCSHKVDRNRMAFSSTKTDFGYVEDSLEQHETKWHLELWTDSVYRNILSMTEK